MNDSGRTSPNFPPITTLLASIQLSGEHLPVRHLSTWFWTKNIDRVERKNAFEAIGDYTKSFSRILYSVCEIHRNKIIVKYIYRGYCEYRNIRYYIKQTGETHKYYYIN